MDKKVLIADDEQNIVISLEFLMKREGYQVEVANDGEEAVRRIRASRPDLVLLDVMMPKKSGFEVCQRIKSTPATRDVVIVMVTALHEVGDFERAVECGTDDFLMAVSALTGKAIPDALKLERGRLVDAMTDSMSLIHGKTFAVFGDPDFCMGISRFLMELGAEPKHILATNGTKPWAKQMGKMLEASPYGQGCQVWPGKDLWHLRSLLVTEPVDFMIGSSYGATTKAANS